MIKRVPNHGGTAFSLDSLPSLKSLQDLLSELTGAMDSSIVSNAGGQVFILEFASEEKIYAELALKMMEHLEKIGTFEPV